jgi:hypothetical protein
MQCVAADLGETERQAANLLSTIRDRSTKRETRFSSVNAILNVAPVTIGRRPAL